MTTSVARRSVMPALGWALAAVLVATTFAWYTSHVWEDYYITYRASKNLVLGHGLVFQPGERVHTFTSPLGVLLPALTLWISGGTSDAAALMGFRLLSVAALGVAAGLLWRLCREQWRLSPLVSALVGLWFLTDAKTVDFSINGMETAFLLLALVLFLRSLQAAAPTAWLKLGVAAAALQWTRPDGVVLGGACVAGFWLFAPATLPHGTRAGALVVFWRALAVAAAIYLPWVAWATWFYGSPIPNTVIAKALPLAFAPLQSWWELLLLPWISELSTAFFPTYSHMGGWPRGLLLLGYGVVGLLAHWWVLPWANPRGRAVSFAAFLFGLYLCCIKVYPWYLPPAALLLFITGGFALSDLRRWWPEPRWMAIAAVWAFGLGATALQVAALVLTAQQMKAQEALIESQRTTIGQFLRQQAHPGDRVFLECVGYIGFFSELKILDYPGLTAPEVVRARKTLGEDWGGLVRVLKPEWLVLRPREFGFVKSAHYPAFTADYVLVRTYSRRREVATLSDVQGRGYLECDQTFSVFRRRVH